MCVECVDLVQDNRLAGGYRFAMHPYKLIYDNSSQLCGPRGLAGQETNPFFDQASMAQDYLRTQAEVG